MSQSSGDVVFTRLQESQSRRVIATLVAVISLFLLSFSTKNEKEREREATYTAGRPKRNVCSRGKETVNCPDAGDKKEAGPSAGRLPRKRSPNLAHNEPHLHQNFGSRPLCFLMKLSRTQRANLPRDLRPAR